jgi:hypothetical protein
MTDTKILYEGTKRLYAWPMQKGQYVDYRGWAMPGNEDPSEQGYLVEYTDGGKPNDERHEGYISWSPATVFEQTYKEVKPDDWSARLVKERDDLCLKIVGLNSFIGTERFHALRMQDRALLEIQQSAMETYARVLQQRIFRSVASYGGEIGKSGHAIPAMSDDVVGDQPHHGHDLPAATD